MWVQNPQLLQECMVCSWFTFISATVQQRHMFWAAGIVDAQFAEYLSSLTDVPSTLETSERDSAGKVLP